MDNKKKIKIFMIGVLVIALILLGLVFFNTAFISAFLLWLSLFLFSYCYYIKDDDNKKLMYCLYVVGVLLIIGALFYMVMRII